MYKYIGKIYISIITSLYMWGALLFGMSVIQIPITKSFETVAGKVADGYYCVEIPDGFNFGTLCEEMYISSNKNEAVIKVEIIQDGQYIYFGNSDLEYAEFYDKSYTYEIITGKVSLLECIFLRGGRTVE